MRRRIRLTGRKQLPKSCVQLKVADVGDRKLLTLDIKNTKALSGFPKDARIKIKLNENKVSETIEFGTLGEPKASGELKNQAFSIPSCQLRIVNSGDEKKGMLLGSTDTWKLNTDTQNKGDQDKDGILLFMPKNIAPRIWQLDIRADELPVVYVDESIPDSRTWAKNDPAFVGGVYPAIVQQIFTEIFEDPTPQDVDWMNKWIQWAELLMPGAKYPVNDDKNAKKQWLELLLDTFSQNHKMLDILVGQMTQGQIS